MAEKYSTRIVPLRKALFENAEEIPFNESTGRVCGAYITPYPPGIPLVTPGEIINKETIDFVDILLRENCRYMESKTER